MKKSILGLAVSALLMAGTVHASTNPNDVSATLSVTGTVMADDVDGCAVNIDKSSVTLTSEIDKLVEQGESVTAGASTPVYLYVAGRNCSQNVLEGSIAFKFVGTADNADGTVLANTDASVTAAKGVGVGVFNFSDGKALKVNSSDYLQASTEGNVIGLQMVKLKGQNPQLGSVTSSVTIEIERL
ncbi:fimbrial protein [Cronobacter malonaticus]|uniref:fimbrial protein n=1 Tax=Cronobacter malonaticus TaxID=413503 RepID=UPI000CFC2BFB|nr:fimbrial protein [Cronobacter malonaticus]ELY2622977.1 type 1 fimbrial protein [Cronobacter malonaticus]ELY3623508.1 type 1 fimbrial protein [Cronobacter malonaticus]